MARHPLNQRDLSVRVGSLDIRTGRWNFGGRFFNLASVTGQMDLAFTAGQQQFDIWLFEIPERVVPNWFGVAVPGNVREFSRPHIFFHPTPAQARLDDNLYQTHHPSWQQLYRYVLLMGLQLAASGRRQILVFPFLTEGARDTLGIFAADWLDIVTDLMTQTARLYDSQAGPAQVTDLVASSYSAGVKYLHTFCHRGAHVSRYLRELYDIDGRYSTYRALCTMLPTPPGGRLVRYDQEAISDVQALSRSAGRNRFHLAPNRWSRHMPPVHNGDDVHAWIHNYALHHALSLSVVG